MITIISSDKSYNGPIMAIDSDILTLYKQILIQRARKSKGRVEEVEFYEFHRIFSVYCLYGGISNTVTKKNFFGKGNDKQKENNL